MYMYNIDLIKYTLYTFCMFLSCKRVLIQLSVGLFAGMQVYMNTLQPAHIVL